MTDRELEAWVRVVVDNNWRGKYREWQRLELLFLEFLTILPEELQRQIKEIRYRQSRERTSKGYEKPSEPVRATEAELRAQVEEIWFRQDMRRFMRSIGISSKNL